MNIEMEEEIDIVVNNLQKNFETMSGNVLALKDLSFSVRRKEIFCIVGPSGCGKSTLLKLLIGLIQPTSGEIWIHPDKKKKFAYVQQHPLLLPWRTLLQNAALGTEIRLDLEKESVKRVNTRIKQLGLMGFENKYPLELSGGMKQRVNMIMALESRPNLLLCDEPFSAIDFVTRLDLNTRFKNLSIGEMTTVFVTHNIEEAVFLGDRVAVMTGRPGTIIETFKPDLKIGKFDAIECRETEQFQYAFKTIWNLLKNNYES